MITLDFGEFFWAVHGMEPLPWQARLARYVIEHQQWPELIDLPTATGKTACIDIALFHLAWCASQNKPWLAARRIAFVIDRRIIVDSAFERAEKIRKALETGREPALTAVSEALMSLGGDEPLCCEKLRGGMPRERGFAQHPAQPMVITSTVDQVGSRLLFRGYGLRSYAQPVHAGLLGHDTIILLDEAHLAGPFVQTVEAIRREQQRATQPLNPLQPVRLVRLSATARASGERFQLDSDDLEHPELIKRLTPPKLARLVEVSNASAERIKALLQEIRATYDEIRLPAPTVAAIVNRVRTARELASRLQADASRNYDVKLVTGRSRPLDRDVLARWLLARAGSGREPCAEDKGLIVVATQALEVGADLDFQGLVTECASLPALRQRFGRLDRLGDYGQARAVIVGSAEQDDDPVYGSALNGTWEWLKDIAQRSGHSGMVDFSANAMEQALASLDVESIESMTEKPGDALQLTPSHVELLCQTSPRPMYSPDVSALLHGLQSRQPDIQVVWRSGIPAPRTDQHPTIVRENEELVTAMLSIVPPTSLEALSLPTRALQAWLTGNSTPATLADIEGVAQEEEDVPSRRRDISKDVWRRVEDRWKASQLTDVRPGDTIVLPDVYGGCDEFGFDPDAAEPVVDLFEIARKKLGRERLIVVTRQTLERQVAPERQGEVDAAWDAVHSAYDSEGATPKELWNILNVALGDSVTSALRVPEQREVECLTAGDGSLYALILREDRVGADDISDEDLSSSRTVPILLERHNAGVGRRAREIAQAVRLDKHSQNLGCAGDNHDLGKADPRFQRVLRAGDHETHAGMLLAKGLRRVCSRPMESGERHEAYSVAVLKAHPELLKSASDPELALYLTGVHHGRGRAQMPFCFDEGTRFAVAVNGRMVEFDGAPNLGALGSGWPTLFWTLNERYGPWGLAYLEALLRLADGLQSRCELEQGGI